MADEEVSLLSTPTTNYGWAKPTVGGDNDAWGGMLNSDLDGIDSTVKSVSTVANAALPLAGGTLTGPVIAAADPAAALGVATKQYVDGARLGDNRVINGDMRIDQRNNGASGIAAGYTCDRWQYSGTQPSKFTWQRQALAAPGFPYSLGVGSPPGYTPLTSDIFAFMQIVEADMISDFQWGTASAQPVTLSFWAVCSLTGTFGGSIRNAALNRSYPFSFSLPVASAFTKIVITIPGDTTGAWTLSGNGIGLYLTFDLGAGASVRGPANAWAAASYVGVTGAVNPVATAGASYNLTGIKLEIGSIATPFNRQSLAKSLADCQRYYCDIANGGNALSYRAAIYSPGSGAVTAGVGYLPVTMRIAPTVAARNQVYVNATAIAFPSLTPQTFIQNITVTAAGTATATFDASFNAEL